MRRSVLAPSAALVCALVGCAPLPETRGARGLYVDAQKAVVLRESADWVSDPDEVESAAGAVLRSVCEAPLGAVEEANRFVTDQLLALGGSARDVWDAEGDGRRFRGARRLERVRQVLERAVDRSATECPYWLERDPGFAGVTRDEGRFVVLAESRGGAAVVVSDGEAHFGGGGGARLLPGVGLGPRLTLATGPELGAFGLLPQTDMGGRTFAGRFTAGWALLFRVHVAPSRVLDVETAITTAFEDGDMRVPPGVRLGLGYGLTTARVGAFMPYALLWAGWEVYPEADGLPPAHTVILGTRVGFDWAP